MEFFHIEQWLWWALCLAAMVSAAVLRGGLSLWVAAASGIVGAVCWVTPEIPNMYQIMLFLLISLAGYAFADFFRKSNPDADKPVDPEEVRQAGERHIGRVITLGKPIVNGFGNIDIDGEQWRIRGEDAAEGKQIRILDADGIDRDVLIVELVEENPAT